MNEDHTPDAAPPVVSAETQLVMAESEIDALRRQRDDWKLRFEVLREMIPQLIMAALMAARLDMPKAGQ